MLGVQGSWRPRGYGDETAAAIDRALKLLVAQAFDAATAVLARNRKLLESGAAELLAHETLGPSDLAKFAAQLVKPPAAIAAQ
jgi:cell division protease FtsH